MYYNTVRINCNYSLLCSIFVRRKDFTQILEKNKKYIPQHPNYLSYVNQNDETWFNYKIHLEGDPEREVSLAVLLFHLPS